MDNLSYGVRGDVAVLTLNNPPVNGLSYGLRCDLLEAFDRAINDPQVRALVLTGGEGLFSGGADLREFGTPKSYQEPNLLSVIAALDSSPKPLVAAIAGNCLGGGLELALSCHWRVAKADAMLGLPEVKLGLLPGAGGTQRLPRAVGLETALNMILSGEPRKASSFAATALVDLVVEGELLPAALDFARRVVSEERPLRRLRDQSIDASAAEPYLQFARNTVRTIAKNLPAPMQCIEAVAAAVNKPFDEGMKIERAAFIQLMNTPESRALRHVFAAERAASKVDGLPADTPLREIRKVGIVGAGTMGGGIAMSFTNAGLPVVLLEVNQAALDRGLSTIRKNYEVSLTRGKISQDQLDARMARIEPTLRYEDLAATDLVIEAVFEELSAKQAVFETLDKTLRRGAILASNTSTLDLNRIAQFTSRPGDVIGLHFFSPANVMRLLEVVRGERTSADVLATAMQLAKRIRKVAVVSGVCDGFIGNRMLARYGAAANDLLNLGASPQQVDRALEQFGMAMGIFRVGDLAGLDIGWAIRKRRGAEHPELDLSSVADRICEAGRYGQKTGAGWYRYDPGRREPLSDPAVEQIIEQWRKERGYTPRTVRDGEIVERCIYALVNEGARILEDGIAQRASDIDVVYLNGYGFPAHRGGPMHYANEVGLPNVVRALRRIAAESPADAAAWTPAALLERLAKEGKNFS
ncbi:MAG TPA: 3-hydroxyacyl-CoA dehydrogenase NAD-binding domain-containing protein [Burkholderiaceae bacterium]|nr:3-hydroxyacyl-CoA dehydrogenase NAD-binding domain-containing protein [Burkholderiaceae bacterium]